MKLLKRNQLELKNIIGTNCSKIIHFKVKNYNFYRNYSYTNNLCN